MRQNMADTDKNIDTARQEMFQRSIRKYLHFDYDRKSIGLLQEKTLHSIVKDFYSPSEACKEVRIGDYVADICYENEIIEIQNGNFGHLVPKLEAFLPKYHVTVVYPVPHRKWTCWIDPQTGEQTARNETHGAYNIYNVFRELYRIRSFLNHPGLTVVLCQIDLEEYRIQDGWSKDKKHGSHRFDRIPLALAGEIILKEEKDYESFIPPDLSMEFTIKEFQKLAKFRGRYFSGVVRILEQMHQIERSGMRGRAFLYKRLENGNMPAKKKTTIMSEETVIDRFLRYVKIDTQSDESTNASPSTAKQHDLAKLLTAELEAMGASEIFYDKEHCYIYATIPSTLPASKKLPVLGFISHMDTSDAASGKDVKPSIVSKYDGKDVVLNEKDPETGSKVVLSPSVFPELLNHKGEDLIVTDGTTLLGADDKGGIAEIMTMASYLLTHKEVKHGKIRIAFTPDEEIGEGTAHFDLKKFGADFAYTVDGGKLGELEYECFNAAEVELIIHGRSVHPGDAKGKMLNATLIAYEFQSMLPAFDNPMYTEKREGFFHLTLMKGTCEKAVVYYIIRDHDKKKFTEKKKLVEEIVAFLNKKYGEGIVELTMEDSYYNMLEKLKPHMHLIENARKAMEQAGVTSIENPIRGGTDGAMLSFKGLPCPNLCTGGYNYHGRFEYASVQEMYKTVEILNNLVAIYGDFAPEKTASSKTAAKKTAKTTETKAKKAVKTKAAPKTAVGKKAAAKKTTGKKRKTK